MHRLALACLALVPLAGCGGSSGAGRRTATLRPACATGEHWDGAACRPRGADGELDAAAAAIAQLRLEEAQAALDRAAAHPLDHASYLRLWQQRAFASATAEDADGARAAFERLLEADPGHAIECERGGKFYRPFEDARRRTAARPPTALELRWRRDLRLGEPVPVEIETLADPSSTLRGLTVYLRPRGESAWRAADVALPPPGTITELVLPPVNGDASTALELFAVATDERGNELHRWASPDRPRELPLRFDPPTPWYRKWWVWATAGGVVAAGTGVIVYAALWEPSDTLDAPVTAR